MTGWRHAKTGSVKRKTYNGLNYAIRCQNKEKVPLWIAPKQASAYNWLLCPRKSETSLKTSSYVIALSPAKNRCTTCAFIVCLVVSLGLVTVRRWRLYTCIYDGGLGLVTTTASTELVGFWTNLSSATPTRKHLRSSRRTQRGTNLKGNLLFMIKVLIYCVS